MALLGIRWLVRGKNDLPATVERLSWPGTASLVLLGICAAFNLLGTLAPPSFIDALIYHLFAPQQFLTSGRLTELPAVWQLYQPVSVEMLFTAAYSLAGERSAALVTAGLGLLAAAGTALLGRQIAGATVGWLAAGIFYCTAMTAWESTSCFIDLGVAALGSLGIYALLRWEQTRQRDWFIITGLLLGFSAACKLNAACFPIIGVLLMGFFSHRAGDRAKTVVARMALLSALCAAPLIPWYARAWLLTGNPIYPFGAAIFGDNTEWRAIRWIFQGYGVGYGVTNRLLAFWNIFARGAAFENGHHFSPLPMLMTPLIFWRAHGERQRAALLACVVIFFALWAMGGHVARYLIPVQPMFCVLAADAICWLGSLPGPRRAMAIAFGSLFLLFGTVNTALYDRQFLPVVFGREPTSSYLSRMTWFYDTYREVCAQLPPGGRVLTSVAPTYYLECAHQRASNAVLSSPERLGQLLDAGHFTHILILANEPLEDQIAQLFPRVRKLWHRRVEVIVSRSFGRVDTLPVALFEVAPPS
ncbi:MAG TPA: glycosyltransferase family 39 protein [Polyangia bacterium]